MCMYISFKIKTGTVSLTFHGIGKEVGTAITGFLFSSYGTRITLCGYSIVTVAFLLIFTVYIFTAKDVDDYMRLSTGDIETDDEKE